MNLSERDYYLGFSVFPDIGPKRFRLLMEFFGSARRAWKTSEDELKDIKLNGNIISKFINFKKNFSIDKFLEKLNSKKINFLTEINPEYPVLLKEIPDPPIVIYIRGDLKRLEKINNTIAIVGTRAMTVYGRVATVKIVTELCHAGFTVVSGLAAGIDTIAHKTAIENNEKTIAVLGNGIDIIYPAANYDLYWKIVNGSGLIISEYPPGYMPTKSSFPLRNRIISGLSKAVVVIEGKKTSGALITAKYALDQGRDVFAVPGPINQPTSEGTSYLIKNGAAVASSAEDIIESL